MSQESDVCCTTSMYDIQNRCIPDEIDLFYFKTCIITHNNNVIEQNINLSMFDILSEKNLVALCKRRHLDLVCLWYFPREDRDKKRYLIGRVLNGESCAKTFLKMEPRLWLANSEKGM